MQDIQKNIAAKLLINGLRVDSSSMDLSQSVNPATEETIGSWVKASPDDARAGIEAAGEAFESWSLTPPVERAEYLLKVALAMRELNRELATHETLEVGKPIKEALREVNAAITAAIYFSGLARRFWSNVTDSEQREKFTLVVRRPVGIVGVITPWNDPLSLAMWGIAPALVAGNTVVFKPSSNAVLISSRLVELFERVDLPKGVLNFVPGSGDTVGEAILDSPKVKMITFTGESTTGKYVARKNSEFLRKQVMELGGKNALIVAKDCEMDVTVNAALYAAFSNAGQKCTAASRIIVERSVLELFTKKFVTGATKLKVGNGLDPETNMGPLISRRAKEKCMRYIEMGKSDGAKLLTGGQDYADNVRRRGYFVQPTIFGEVDNSTPIAQDEIFGPVVCVICAENVDEAIEIANDSRYGLSSAIFTKDVQSIFKAIYKIDAGLTFANQGTVNTEVGVPFGGVKDSGYGLELGEEALEHYTQKKTVFIDHSYKERPWFFSAQSV